MLTIEDVIDGAKKKKITQMTIADYARLRGKSPLTISRKLDAGFLNPVLDTTTGRRGVALDDAAIAYLEGTPFVRNYQDKAAIARMAHARSFKRDAR